MFQLLLCHKNREVTAWINNWELLYAAPAGRRGECTAPNMKEQGSSSSGTKNVQRHKRKPRSSSIQKKKKNVWELKPERRDDYFNSQLSDRLSSLLLTSSDHLAHVKQAQHFCVATCCGTFVARHQCRYSGRPTKEPWKLPCL